MNNLAIYAEDDSLQSAMQACETAWHQEQERKAEYAEVLVSDKAMAKWAERNFPELKLIRAIQYKKYTTFIYQDFYQCGWLENPMRPIVMRGSLYVLYRKWSLSYYGSSPNGWCSNVLDRWVKKTKYTAFTWEDYESSGLQDAKNRLRKKHGANGQGWKYDYTPRANGIVWINGKEYYDLSGHQLIYLKKIWRISKGIEEMEHKKRLHGYLP